MLVLALAVSALAAAARTDCDACVAGLCHSRRPIASGFPVTDQLAIDRTNNVLYLQYNNHMNTAIFLDDLQTRRVNMMRTSGMAVDQKTGVLYLGTKEVDDTFYKYDLANNKTESVYVEDYVSKPEMMVYALNYLHFIAQNYTSLRIYNTTDRILHYYDDSPLQYYFSDFIITEDNLLCFVINEITYMYDLKKYVVNIVGNKKYKLSSDQYSNAYFADKIEKVIYKRDKATGGLEKYASYTGGLIEDFVFDKEHRIVFRDAGGVAQWVPAPAHRRCAFDPQGGFLMKVV